MDQATQHQSNPYLSVSHAEEERHCLKTLRTEVLCEHKGKTSKNTDQVWSQSGDTQMMVTMDSLAYPTHNMLTVYGVFSLSLFYSSSLILLQGALQHCLNN